MPGTKRAYCNNGFALLGEIVVRAEKAPLQDVMQRRIFGPLGMRDTDILDTYDERLTTLLSPAAGRRHREQFARAGIAVPDEPLVDGHNIRGEFRAEFNQGHAGGRRRCSRTSPTWRATRRRCCGRAPASCGRRRSTR